MKNKSNLRKSLVKKIERYSTLAIILKKIQKLFIDLFLILPYSKNFNFTNALSLFELSRKINTKNKKLFFLNIPKLSHPLIFRSGTSDINVFKQIFHFKEYEIEELDNLYPKTIIDCGSNTGFSTIYFKNRYPESKIISIEPEDSNFEILKKNIEYYNNVTAIKTAVWSKDASLKIINPENKGWGFRVEESAPDNEGTFMAMSISSIMKKNGINKIDILKIDIEGAEKNLFEKNTDLWLPKTKVIIIELHERYAPSCTKIVFDVMRKNNFSKSQSGENYVFIKNDY